jgi:hypothetical protein
MSNSFPSKLPLATALLKFDIEKLEKRTMLSSSLYSVDRIPAFTATSGDIRDVANGPFAKGGANLANLYTDYLKWRKADAHDDKGDLVAFKPKQDLFIRHGETVGLTLRSRIGVDKLIEQLRPLGIQLINRKPTLNLINVLAPISQLNSIVSNKNVATAMGMYAPVTNQQGIVDNQANQAMDADKARAVFGVDGTGVKVGVLSDSANSIFTGGLPESQKSGDLPDNVEVLDDNDFGDDEGRAMMELIYDMAPGADLAFATAFNGVQSFADNIVALKDAGAKVIVDDVTYFTEPFFQDGVIAEAVGTVRAAGSTYLSSAGNFGFGGFQQAAHYDPQPDGTSLIDFRPGNGVDSTMMVHLERGGRLTLQWDNPWTGLVGDVTADLDIFFKDPVTKQIIAQGTDRNFLTGAPLEFIQVPAGDYEMTIRLRDLKEGASPPTIFKLAGEAELTETEYPGLQSSTFGHNSSRYAISVGAVPFFGAEPFIDDVAQKNNELFSSAGPVTLIFNGDGTRRAKPLTLQKPDLSGIDGGNTTFFFLTDDSKNDIDSFPNFFGTSAAAPDVAAVAALMLSFKSNLTPDQVQSGLIQSARIHPLNGAKHNTWDPQGGWGLVDATRALQVIDDAPYVNISRVTPDPRSTPVEQISFTFSEPVTGFDLSDLTLKRDSQHNPNLLTGSETLTTTDNITWVLSGLSGLTDTDGTYALTLKAAGSGIIDADSNELKPDSREVFRIKNAAPNQATNLTATAISSTAIQLEWRDNSSNETRFRIERGTNPDFTAGLKVINAEPNTTRIVDENLDPSTHYYYRIRAFNGNGYSAGSRADTFTLSNGDVIVDNTAASVTGNWTTSSSGTGIFGDDFLTDGNSGKGSKSVTFTPNIRAAGRYIVYARWVSGSNRATNVPIDVNSAEGSQTFTKDQKNTGKDGAWVLLGTFQFNKGTGGSVTIRNAGTNGVVVADAVRFLSTTPVEPAGITITSTSTTSIFSGSRIQHSDEDPLNLG